MHVQTTNIRDVLILTPNVFIDDRGSFFESFNQKVFNDILLKYDNCMQNVTFVQDNHSTSKKQVLRGLHYQVQKPQAKLVRVVKGSALDVVVDMRKHSPTLGKHIAVELSSQNQKQLWIPSGFAHGFLALSTEVEFLYKTTDYRYGEFERTLLWNDKDININWGIVNPILSDKDKVGIPFKQVIKEI